MHAVAEGSINDTHVTGVLWGECSWEAIQRPEMRPNYSFTGIPFTNLQ